ncbi:MAG: transposase [Bacteroidota bacterium]|nr:transposase [Bacteroidota bacterium]
MEYYRRHLPHFLPSEAIFFVTFRLVNSLPVWIIDKLRNEYDSELALAEYKKTDPSIKKLPEEFYRRYFLEFDGFLDNQKSNDNWLNDSRVAKVVADAIHFRANIKYDLICFCIMPNHVHLVIEILEKHNNAANSTTKYLTKVLQSLKSYTAIQSNIILQRDGQFWQSENYDRVIRNEKEFEEVINYVAYNPVKAGLVSDVKDWPFTFCKYTIE